MSTLSMSAETQPMAGAWPNFSAGAPLKFVAFAAMLAAFTFTAPISSSWMRSTIEHYDNADTMESSVRDGTAIREIALGSLGLFGIAAFAWPGGKVLNAPSVLSVVCAAYLGWCVASIFWSYDPAISMRRVISLVCELAAGMAIAKRSSPRQLAWIVFACTAIWLVLGVLAELSLGTFQPGQQGYRFAGLFHPNDTGTNCALLAMTALYLRRGAEQGKLILLIIAGVAFAFLILTGSRSAMIGLLASIALMSFAVAPATKKLGHVVLVGISVAFIGIVVSLGMYEIFVNVVTMGRDDSEMSSFTGRVPLWQELLKDYVSERPLIGHGYGAFWSPTHISDISKSQTWQVASTHSAYIDLLLNSGGIGTVLCLWAMVLACVVALRLERRHANAGYGVIGMILVYGLVAGFFETTIGTTCFLSFFRISGVCFLMYSAGSDVERTLADVEATEFVHYPSRVRAGAIA